MFGQTRRDEFTNHTTEICWHQNGLKTSEFSFAKRNIDETEEVLKLGHGSMNVVHRAAIRNYSFRIEELLIQRDWETSSPLKL